MLYKLCEYDDGSVGILYCYESGGGAPIVALRGRAKHVWCYSQDIPLPEEDKARLEQLVRKDTLVPGKFTLIQNVIDNVWTIMRGTALEIQGSAREVRECIIRHGWTDSFTDEEAAALAEACEQEPVGPISEGFSASLGALAAPKPGGLVRNAAEAAERVWARSVQMQFPLEDVFFRAAPVLRPCPYDEGDSVELSDEENWIKLGEPEFDGVNLDFYVLVASTGHREHVGAFNPNSDERMTPRFVISSPTADTNALLQLVSS